VTNDRNPIAQRTPTRAQAGLPEAGFVFCCFNNNFKIRSASFDIWMRLLHRIPGSVLWLLEDNPSSRQNLCAEAQARGVDPRRLVFAPRIAQADHLARHRLADLFLDTLPYNAHTTSTDALWVGLPVLTCTGTTLVGRVAGSLLLALGVPELVNRDAAGNTRRSPLQLATIATDFAACARRSSSSARRMRSSTPIAFAGTSNRPTWRRGKSVRQGQPPRPIVMRGARLAAASSKRPAVRGEIERKQHYRDDRARRSGPASREGRPARTAPASDSGRFALTVTA
jgi:hypothetical protein